MNKLFDSTSLPAKQTNAPPTKVQMLRGEMTTMFLYQRNIVVIPTIERLAMRQLLVRRRYTSKRQRKNYA
jgi:hypothetical protein